MNVEMVGDGRGVDANNVMEKERMSNELDRE